jgi:hypothetical protein
VMLDSLRTRRAKRTTDQDGAAPSLPSENAA